MQYRNRIRLLQQQQKEKEKRDRLKNVFFQAAELVSVIPIIWGLITLFFLL